MRHRGWGNFLEVTTRANQGRQGRPSATSHEWIERVAFELFQSKGFEATTLDDIARAAGIGRRTFFRYFDSKNDIPWGRFDESLATFRETLRQMPETLPVHVAVHQGVLAFNTYPPESVPQHRQRMSLILNTPALQAHSVLRYAEWRRVIAEYVAERLNLSPDDLLPRTIGHVSLALAVTSYEHWLQNESDDLLALLDRAMTELREFLHAPGASHLSAN